MANNDNRWEWPKIEDLIEGIHQNKQSQPITDSQKKSSKSSVEIEDTKKENKETSQLEEPIRSNAKESSEIEDTQKSTKEQSEIKESIDKSNKTQESIHTDQESSHKFSNEISEDIIQSTKEQQEIQSTVSKQKKDSIVEDKHTRIEKTDSNVEFSLSSSKTEESVLESIDHRIKANIDSSEINSSHSKSEVETEQPSSSSKKTESSLQETTSKKKEETELQSTTAQKKTEIENQVDKTHALKRESSVEVETQSKGRESSDINLDSTIAKKQEIDSTPEQTESVKQESSLDETRRVLTKIENELSTQGKTKEKEENLLQNIFATSSKKESDVEDVANRVSKEEKDLSSTRQTKKIESTIFTDLNSNKKSEEEISDDENQTSKSESEIKNVNSTSKEEIRLRNQEISSEKDEVNVMRTLEDIFKSEEEINTIIDSSLKFEEEIDTDVEDSNKEEAEENAQSVIGLDDVNFSIKTNVIYPIDSPVSAQLTENNYVTSSRVRNKDEADSETEGNLNYNIDVEDSAIIENGTNKTISSKYESSMDSEDFRTAEISTKNYNYQALVTPSSGLENEFGYLNESDTRNKIVSSEFSSVLNENRPSQATNNANFTSLLGKADRENVLGNFEDIIESEDRGILGDFNDIILPIDQNTSESGYVATERLRNKVDSSLADSMIGSENKLFTESIDKNYLYSNDPLSNESNAIITPISPGGELLNPIAEYSQYENYPYKEDRNKLKTSQESFSVFTSRDIKTLYVNDEISSNILKENNLEYTSEIKFFSPKDGYTYEGLTGYKYIDKPVGLELNIIDNKYIAGVGIPNDNLHSDIKIYNRESENLYSIMNEISNSTSQFSNNYIYDVDPKYDYKLFEDFDSTQINTNNSNIVYGYRVESEKKIKFNSDKIISSSLNKSFETQQLDEKINFTDLLQIYKNDAINFLNYNNVNDYSEVVKNATSESEFFLTKFEISQIFESEEEKLFVPSKVDRFIGAYVDSSRFIANDNENNPVKQFKVNYDYTAINKPYIYQVKSWKINNIDDSTLLPYIEGEVNGRLTILDYSDESKEEHEYTDIITIEDSTKQHKDWSISSGEFRTDSRFDYFDALRPLPKNIDGTERTYNPGDLLNVINNENEDVYQQNKKINYLDLLEDRSDSSITKSSTLKWTGKNWIVTQGGTEVISPNSAADFSDTSWRNRDSFDLTAQQLATGTYQQINKAIDYNTVRTRISKIYNVKTQSGSLIDSANYIYSSLNTIYTAPIYNYSASTSTVINNPQNVLGNTTALQQKFVNWDYKSLVIKNDNSIKTWNSHDDAYNATRPSYNFDTALASADIRQNVVGVTKSENVKIKQQTSNFSYTINDSTLSKEWYADGSASKTSNPSYNLSYYYDKELAQRPSLTTQTVSSVNSFAKQQASNFIYSQPTHSTVKNYYSVYDDPLTAENEGASESTFFNNNSINYISYPTRISKSNSSTTSGGNQQRLNFTYNEPVDFSHSKKKFNEFQIEPYSQITSTRWNNGIVSSIASYANNLLSGTPITVEEYDDLSSEDKNKYQLIRTSDGNKYYEIPTIDPIYTHVVDATKNLINYSTIVDIGTNPESTADDTTYIISSTQNKYVIRTSSVVNQETVNFNYGSGFYDHLVSRKAGETPNNVNQGIVMSILGSDALMDGATSAIALLPAISNLIYPYGRKDVHEPVWNASPLKLINDGIRVVRDTISDGISKQPKVIANVTNVDSDNKRTDVDAFSVHTPRDISSSPTDEVLKRWRQSNRPRYIFKGNDAGSNIFNAIMVYLVPGAINNISSMFFGTNPWLNEILKSTLGTLSHLDNWNQIKNLFNNDPSFAGLGIDTSSVDSVMNDFSDQIKNDSSGSDFFDFNNAMMKRAMRFLNSELPRMLASGAQNSSYEGTGTTKRQYSLYPLIGGPTSNNKFNMLRGFMPTAGLDPLDNYNNIGSVESAPSQMFGSFKDYIAAIRANVTTSIVSKDMVTNKETFTYRNDESSSDRFDPINKDTKTLFDEKSIEIIKNSIFGNEAENQFRTSSKDIFNLNDKATKLSKDFRTKYNIASKAIGLMSPSQLSFDESDVKVRFDINEKRENFIDDSYNLNFNHHDFTNHDNFANYNLPLVKDDYMVRTSSYLVTDKSNAELISTNNKIYSLTDFQQSKGLKDIFGKDIDPGINSDNLNLLSRSLYRNNKDDQSSKFSLTSILGSTSTETTTHVIDKTTRMEVSTQQEANDLNLQNVVEETKYSTIFNPYTGEDETTEYKVWIGDRIESHNESGTIITKNDIDRVYTTVNIGDGTLNTRIKENEFKDNQFEADRNIYRTQLEKIKSIGPGGIKYNYSRNDGNISTINKPDTKIYGYYQKGEEKVGYQNLWRGTFNKSKLTAIRDNSLSPKELVEGFNKDISLASSMMNIEWEKGYNIISTTSNVSFSASNEGSDLINVSNLRYIYTEMMGNPTTKSIQGGDSRGTFEIIQSEKTVEEKSGTVNHINFGINKPDTLDIFGEIEEDLTISGTHIEVSGFPHRGPYLNSSYIPRRKIWEDVEHNNSIQNNETLGEVNYLINKPDTPAVWDVDEDRLDSEIGLSSNTTERKSSALKTNDGMTFDASKKFYVMSNKYKNFQMGTADENYDLTGCGYIYGVMHVMDNGASNAYKAANGSMSRLVIPFQFDADISSFDRQSNWNTVGAFGRSSDWFIWSGSSSKQATLKTSYAIVSPDKDIKTTFGSEVIPDKKEINNFKVGNGSYDYMKYFTERYILSLLGKYEALLVPMQAGYSPPILKIRRGPMEWSWSRKGGYHETAWICTDLSVEQRSQDAGFTFSRTPRLFDVSLTLKETLLSWDDFASGWGLTQEGGPETFTGDSSYALQNISPTKEAIGTVSGANPNFTGKGNSFPGLISARFKDNVTIKDSEGYK